MKHGHGKRDHGTLHPIFYRVELPDSPQLERRLSGLASSPVEFACWG